MTTDAGNVIALLTESPSNRKHLLARAPMRVPINPQQELHLFARFFSPYSGTDSGLNLRQTRSVDAPVRTFEVRPRSGRHQAKQKTCCQRKSCKAASQRKKPNHSTTSKVAYFKRKYAEEKDLHGGLHGYFQKHLILQEDRSCILKLSLEKLRFLEDPETYLRRSVLINNLLRKIHHEEEELEEEEEEDEIEEEEDADDIGGGQQQRLVYPDRKRVKMLVTDYCSQAFHLEKLQCYQLVPYYPSVDDVYTLHTCPGLTQNHPVLLCNLDDHG
ncbi:uncharacterized protein ACNS7B_000247 [Menidia menidia]